MAISAENIRTLHKFEVRALKALERLMERYEWVPADTLRHETRLSGDELRFRTGKLLSLNMIRFNTVPEDAYALIYGGYDALALMSLTRAGTVHALGSLVGEGKESVVYEALGLTPVVLKFHHVGQRSFQAVSRNRDYGQADGHRTRLHLSRVSAAREYEALRTLHPDVHVPLPVATNRHVIVMERVEGATLNRCRVEEPRDLLTAILADIGKAYRKGIIHSDLSEFNVMAGPDGFRIIDWPQWVSRDHPNSDALLTRDVATIVRYFCRKYRVRYDEEDALACVKG